MVFDRSLANTYSQGLVGGLRALGVAVDLVGPAAHPAADVSLFARAGVQGQHRTKLVDAALGVPRLAAAVARRRPSVLHFQWPGESLRFAQVLKPLTGATVAFTVHNPEPRGDDADAQAALIRLSDTVIVHGPTLRNAVIERYRLAPNRVAVVPCGNSEHAITRVDRALARATLGLPAGGPIFTFVGQLIARKGIDTLIQAFRLHCERGGAGALVLAGANYGVNENALRAALGPFVARAHFLTAPGDIPSAQIDAAIAAATLVVLPFHEASQSASVIAAMTHGRCVVSTALGEIPATLGDNGVIVPPRDVEALASALQLDPAHCDERGKAAREHVLTALNWTDLARLTLQAYANARPSGAFAAFGNSTVSRA